MIRQLLIACCGFLAAMGSANAQLYDGNNNIRMSVIGEINLEVPGGTLLSPSFAVQVKDAAGQPVSDLLIMFDLPRFYSAQGGGASNEICRCGWFIGQGQQGQAYTDEDGIAVAPDFLVAGPTYVLAFVPEDGTPRNIEMAAWPMPMALFGINYVDPFPVQPWGPIPDGTSPQPLGVPQVDAAGYRGSDAPRLPSRTRKGIPDVR
ncbi:MAG: hypothetical protein J0H15_13350 [Xanthomonadales bacterium]|nr:hypothetical protein [Xanthomonadales bacterium]